MAFVMFQKAPRLRSEITAYALIYWFFGERGQKNRFYLHADLNHLNYCFLKAMLH